MAPLGQWGHKAFSELGRRLGFLLIVLLKNCQEPVAPSTSIFLFLQTASRGHHLDDPVIDQQKSLCLYPEAQLSLGIPSGSVGASVGLWGALGFF